VDVGTSLAARTHGRPAVERDGYSLAGAMVLNDDLVTEDSLILARAEPRNRKHGIHILRFKDLTKRQRN
jgi:hypothetical protein